MTVQALSLREFTATPAAAPATAVEVQRQALGTPKAFETLLADIRAADADEAAALLKLPLWGITVATDGLPIKWTERALLPGDAAELAAQKIQDMEMGDDGEPYSEVVITIRRVPA